MDTLWTSVQFFRIMIFVCFNKIFDDQNYRKKIFEFFHFENHKIFRNINMIIVI